MTKNKALLKWLDEVARMTKPDKIFWIDGSQEENNRLMQEMVEAVMATQLNSEKRPGCYLFRNMRIMSVITCNIG